MAHRSDRRGRTPITRLARKGRASDWLPARGFHDGPEPQGSTDEAEDTTAVRPSCKLRGYRQPRRSARVKALRPPSAVRCAQP